MKRYIRSDRHYSGTKYIVVLKDGELVKKDTGAIVQLNDEMITASVDSLTEASKVVREYIDSHLLSSSTFTGGAVLDAHTHEQVARISYNGRIWDLDDNEIDDDDFDEIATDEYGDIVDALLNNKPYDFDRFHEYWEAFHQPEKGAIKASAVKVGDVIKNTEDASEINIGDEFRVNRIGKDVNDIGDYITFDFVFDVTMLSGDYEGTDCKLHYMKDEYVGVPVSDVSASTKISAASAIDHISVDSYTILRDVLIDVLNDSNDEVFDNFPNVEEAVEDYIARVRDLCSMREYKKVHPAEVAEINALSDEDLIDISEKIWETT